MDWMQQVRDFYWITETEAMQIVTEQPRDQTIFIEFTQYIFCFSLMLPRLSWIGIGCKTNSLCSYMQSQYAHQK